MIQSFSDAQGRSSSSNSEFVTLGNGVKMPRLFQGLPLICGLDSIGLKDFIEIVRNSVEFGVYGFDTSHDYGKSEEFLKESFIKLQQEGVSREKLFVVSKIGNAQQIEGNIAECVDTSLRTMGLDYIDLMLLHWPVPGFYTENWSRLIDVYRSGKVRCIGIANAQVRHLEALAKTGLEVQPQVVQTEIHPFNSCGEVRGYCANHGIALQSCSSLCLMIDKVKKNPLLLELGAKYGKSVAQIMLRWLLQINIAPVFRAFKKKHLQEMQDLFRFNISEQDMAAIASLNEDYRFHPESLNCPGF